MDSWSATWSSRLTLPRGTGGKKLSTVFSCSSTSVPQAGCLIGPKQATPEGKGNSLKPSWCQSPENRGRRKGGDASVENKRHLPPAFLNKMNCIVNDSQMKPGSFVGRGVSEWNHEHQTVWIVDTRTVLSWASDPWETVKSLAHMVQAREKWLSSGVKDACLWKTHQCVQTRRWGFLFLSVCSLRPTAGRKSSSMLTVHSLRCGRWG